MRRTPTCSRATRLAVAGIASFALLGLTACSDDGDEAESASDSASESKAESASDSASESTTPTESATPSEEPTESADTEAGGSGDQPEWADPVTTPGEQIASIEAADVTVDVYQVGTAKATKTGQFVDPDTNKPLIAKGDEVVFVNYVVTNNGDDIDLGASGVTVDARYDDWPYLQGMDSVVDPALFEKQDVNADAFADDAYRDPSVYTFASGQQFSFGENFGYQKGSPIAFKVTMTPVDAQGELLHDDRVEAEGSAEIQ